MKNNPQKNKSSLFKFIIPGAGVFVLVILAAYFFLLPKKPTFSGLKKGKRYNYIIITVDTLRADRLNCYGFNRIETPNIDRFARDGIKFDQCIAQTPLTLPSHTSLFTGTQPPYNGVRDNGGFLVPPQLVTLAELFKEQGYETSAFVAAYVLDSKWGLNQGFDTYFDNFDLSQFKKISLGSVQRSADDVLDEALPWLSEKKDDPFFTWIHLYDPHTPYEPPGEFEKKYPGRPYLGEIAFHLREHEKAKRLFNEALEKNSRLTGPRYRLPQCCFAEGREKQAKSYLASERELAPEDAEALV